MNTIQHEQLFTDLTSEQAAVIEGGATLTLQRIECLKASSDPVGGDEPYINVNGNKQWSGSMEQGSTRTINKKLKVGSVADINMFDDDPWPNPDDPIGKPNTVYQGAGDGSYTSFGNEKSNSWYRLYYTFV
jgi:hypothetical protein